MNSQSDTLTITLLILSRIKWTSIELREISIRHDRKNILRAKKKTREDDKLEGNRPIKRRPPRLPPIDRFKSGLSSGDPLAGRGRNT